MIFLSLHLLRLGRKGTKKAKLVNSWNIEYRLTNDDLTQLENNGRNSMIAKTIFNYKPLIISHDINL